MRKAKGAEEAVKKEPKSAKRVQKKEQKSVQEALREHVDKRNQAMSDTYYRKK